jgi:imidazolonepropionase-like amidohydrolase
VGVGPRRAPCSAGTTQAEAHELGRLILTDVHLVDGEHAPRPGVTIVIDGERIASVSEDAGPTPAPGDRLVDLGGRTVMPGMFSCHFHATFDGATLEIFPLGIDKPPGYLMLRAANAVHTALFSGFTSVVGAGSGDDIDAQLELAIEDGLVEGPRVTPGSRNLGTPGGYIDLANWWWRLDNIGACRMVDGPEQCRSVVRDEIRRGARMIKLFATGGHGNVNSETREFARDELAAVVETAHSRGAKVRAHCAWKPRILECIELGVDVIDHADELDGECIEAMVSAGTFVAPSALYLEKLLALPELRVPGSEPVIEASERELENLLQRVPEANAAGVKLVVGDDFGTVLLPHGTYAEELDFYVKRFGISPLDVIRWATRNGAELAGVEAELGTVEAGKLADLLVVDGDPTVDISVLGDRDKLRWSSTIRSPRP